MQFLHVVNYFSKLFQIAGELKYSDHYLDENNLHWFIIQQKEIEIYVFDIFRCRRLT